MTDCRIFFKANFNFNSITFPPWQSDLRNIIFYCLLEAFEENSPDFTMYHSQWIMQGPGFSDS
jgi:hypothetical protein